MKLNRTKVEIAMANHCINPYELCEKADIQQQTFRRVMSEKECKPVTVGKIARVLGVKVEDLI